MSEPNEERAAERLDRLVGDLLAGRHLKATPPDAADRDAIRLAARMAGAREGYPRMSPAFRRRLARMLERGDAPSWLNRRAALTAGLGLAAGAVGGSLVTPLEGLVASRPRPQPRPRRTSAPAPTPSVAASRSYIEPHPGLARWIDTGVALRELVEGVPHRVTAGAIGAFLVRHGDQVVGMSSYCTHLPCELVWQQDRHLLTCPCHNLGFNVQGESLGAGYSLPALPLVKVRVVDGRVEVLGT